MGMVNCKIYDSIDMDLIEGKHSESVLSVEKNIKNGIVTAWKNNIAAALINKDYGWSADATTIAFNSYNAIMSYGSEQGTPFKDDLGTYSPRKTTINVGDSSGGTNCCMFSTTGAAVSAGAISFIGYLNGAATTIINGTLGILTSYDNDGNSGNGTPVWAEQFATFSGASLGLQQYQTLKITWTITLTG